MCLQPAELLLPQGRIQVNPGTRFTRGTRFMNVEIAALLSEAYRLLVPQGYLCLVSLMHGSTWPSRFVTGL